YVRATHKMEMAQKFGTPEQIRSVADRYQKNLPTQKADQSAVAEIIRQSRHPEEHLFAKETENWVKYHEKLTEPAATERVEVLMRYVQATHRIEIAQKFATPEEIRSVDGRYHKNLPTQADD